MLISKNENLLKKNVALDKELKQTKLALAEALRAKAETDKELKDQEETLANAIKSNAALVEEVKTKDEIISTLKENMNIVVNDINNVNNGDVEESEVLPEPLRCNICDYTTNTSHDLEKHKPIHKKQYHCNQGCENTVFSTQLSLKNHIQSVHSQNISEFKCNKCDAKFIAQHQLKQHISRKHELTKQQKLHCKSCGQIFSTNRDLQTHESNCDEQFTVVEKKECIYFKRGNCRKGSDCKFEHKTNNVCRNGARCRYFARGMCKFIHPRSQALQNNAEHHNSNNRYCRFKENCFQLASCTFRHSPQDFYNFVRKNSPPMWRVRSQGVHRPPRT